MLAYIIKLSQNFPHHLFGWAAGIFCAGLVLLILWKGLKRGLHYSAVLLLLEYLSLLLTKTVFLRDSSKNHGYDFTPFWSYAAIQDGRQDLVIQNIMNVAVFIPVGMMLGIAQRNIKWWMVMIVGMGISATIETLQYLYNLGFAEIDDVIHNTLGCMIGYLAYIIFIRLKVKSTFVKRDK